MSAPRDPRLDQPIPAYGELPAMATFGAAVTRVLAPNPSPMTLDGTNTYVVGEPGAGAVVVIDPGPDDPSHRQRVRDVVAGRDAEVVAILVTHHHADHAEAAAVWAADAGVPVVAADPAVAGPSGRVVADGDEVAVGGTTLRVVATPGHTGDHVAFRTSDGTLLVGDHVLGRGTSVVAAPDGDLAAYLASLRRVLDLGPDVLLPGHGPALTEDPSAVVRYYLAHRAYREEQILAALVAGPATPRALVEDIYADVDRRLWDAAEASTRATLELLRAREQVRWRDDRVERRG